MKKQTLPVRSVHSILGALALVLALSLPPARAFAQGLNLQAGYQSQSLLSLSRSVGGIDFDSGGNLFYIGGSQANANDTQVIEASKASGYATLTPIVDYNTSTYPSFLKVHGSNVVYGDFVSGGNVNVSGTVPTNPLAAPTPVANIPNNYDLAFSGASAFVSANISGSDNKVYQLNLSTGAYVPVLDTGGDYSGPIAFTSAGDLIYGRTGIGNSGGIYIFGAAAVQTALTSGTLLQLADASKVIGDSGNTSFAIGANDALFQSFCPFGGTASLSLFNLAASTSSLIGTVDNNGYFFSAMAYQGGYLTVAETDGFSTTNILEVIPEPGEATLGLAGFLLVAALGGRRRVFGGSAS